MTFRFVSVAGRSALLDRNDNWFDLARITGGDVSSDPMLALANGAALHAASARLAAATPDGILATAQLAAPVPRPRNCFAVGLNYGNHAAESGMDLPEQPLVFTKFPSCIVGPDVEVSLSSSTADWEVELVVVIGTAGRHIAVERAWDHIVGITIGQDLSDRALQFAAKPAHFDLGKSRDGYGPLGPVLVSTDSVANPDDLALTCAINGRCVQDDRTSNLIFTVPVLVAYLSGIMTLAPGDIIFTGTPAGVGASTGTFLQPGDVIVSTIEGIGTLTTHCVA